MSQEKVDRYKESKANRKQEVKRQRRNRLLAKIGGWAVLVLFIVFIVWSAWIKINPSSKEEETTPKYTSQVTVDELQSMLGVTETTNTETSADGEEETTTKADAEKETEAETEAEEPSAAE